MNNRNHDFLVRDMGEEDIPIVAQMHFDLFGTGEMHGFSMAKLGLDFLKDIYYPPNLDNPYFYCDVAIYQGVIVGFSVYSTNRISVYRYMLRYHIHQIILRILRLVAKKPSVVPLLLNNVRYLRGEELHWLDNVMGWWQVAGVAPEYRTKEFKQQTGIQVAKNMFAQMEKNMLNNGCYSWYGVVHPENNPINYFLQHQGANLVGSAMAQGMLMNYYVKTMVQES